MKQSLAVLAACIGLAACNQESADREPDPGDYAERMAVEHRDDSPAPSPATAPEEGAHPIRSQSVDYGTLDGQALQGYLAYPAAAEGGLPGVLVFHEWWGLNDNIRAMTDKLAGEGYVALAADLYGGRAAETPEAARALLDKAMSDPAALSQNLRQAHAFLKGQVKATRIGTIGWCFGGGISLRTALLLPDEVDAAVIYYGHVPTTAEALKGLKAPVLGLFGAEDQGIPVEGVREFESALKSLGIPADVRIYEGAGHAFANPSGKNYQARAAEDAWRRSMEFLAGHLRGG